MIISGNPARSGAWGLLLAGLFLCATTPSARSAEVYDADVVKAAFLVRFTGYVDWPEAAMNQPEFVIAVLGSDTVAAELARLVPRRTIKDLPARVIRIHDIAQVAGAQVLYIGAAFVGELPALLRPLAAQPLLVVTDRERALDEGGMVNFMLVEHRVRFEISLTAATQAGLRLGPALLSVAVRVQGAPRSDVLCEPDPTPPMLVPPCSVRVARS